MALSALLLDTVEQALTTDGPGSTPRSLVDDVCPKGWAPRTVRAALGELVAAGRARYEGDYTKRRYWRCSK